MRRLRRPRARGRGRRHLAGQHLSRLRVRRPVAPVLVLVRAEPRVDADLLAAARDLGRTCAAAPTSSASARTCAWAARVESATWLEAERRWELETSQGTLRARVLVAGMGPLTEPRIPDIPGLEDFEGEVFHSARWNHDFDLAGKRVASIGTGASAIQYVPEIAKQVERAARLPAHAAVGRCRTRTGRSPTRERRAVPRASRRCSGSCAAASTPAARCSCSAS